MGRGVKGIRCGDVQVKWRENNRRNLFSPEGAVGRIIGVILLVQKVQSGV